MKTPVKIAVSGAAGQISYSLLFRLIAGDLLGPDQPISLSLLEVPQSLIHLEGVVMELQDCASPLLHEIACHSHPEAAFDQADLVFLIGAFPRGPGMERRDLLEINAAIFSVQGRALNAAARPGVKVLIVGNPANTNAMIAQRNAPDLAPQNFSAMTRLDHNRAVSFLARRCQRSIGAVEGVIIWGNHSTTQYPDLFHAAVDGRPALECVGRDWYEQEFIGAVQNRGAEVIRIRGKSSAASGANAALEHMRDWIFGTPDGRWVSMAVCSDGSYGIEPGLMFSYPVEIRDGEWRIVQGLDIGEFSQVRIEASEAEIKLERDMVRHLMP
jgi:malate dehydrogenase